MCFISSAKFTRFSLSLATCLPRLSALLPHNALFTLQESSSESHTHILSPLFWVGNAIVDRISWHALITLSDGGTLLQANMCNDTYRQIRRKQPLVCSPATTVKHLAHTSLTNPALPQPLVTTRPTARPKSFCYSLRAPFPPLSAAPITAITTRKQRPAGMPPTHNEVSRISWQLHQSGHPGRRARVHATARSVVTLRWPRSQWRLPT